MISLKQTLRSGWILGIGLTALIVIGFATRSRWWEPSQNWVRATISGNRKASSLDSHDHGGTGDADPHAHEGHEHAHDTASSLELSKQAQGNIGLTPEYLQPITLETFRRTITVPGMIVDRPGRTRVEISTPMAGVITHVHAVQGEAVKPGTLLFQLRITAEELVSTQTDLLKSVGDPVLCRRRRCSNASTQKRSSKF
jgi:acetyl/propionyl-CoA carboxylase alpha subunit